MAEPERFVRVHGEELDEQIRASLVKTRAGDQFIEHCAVQVWRPVLIHPHTELGRPRLVLLRKP